MSHWKRYGLAIGWVAILAPALLAQEKPRYQGEGPVELHVAMHATNPAELERVFRSAFHPAIRQQEGFQYCRLLKAKRPGVYLLSIGFSSEDLRVAWANSELHREVWPKMEGQVDTEKMRIRALGVVPHSAE